MEKLMRKQSILPITLDGGAVEQIATLQSIHVYIEESLTKQARTEKAMKEYTKKLEKVHQHIEGVEQRLKETEKTYIAKRIIREQLQKERYEKAHKLAKENVQLTTEDFFTIEETVGRFGERFRKTAEEIVAEEATKRETTQVMRQITSYVKKKLELRSIEDIPNGLIAQHKVLVKQMTRKKLDMFQKKGCC